MRRKVKRLTGEKAEHADKYRLMLLQTPYQWCWSCGRTSRVQPTWWGGPWLIERAHIVSQPRELDRRVAILLCSLCHKAQHGYQFGDGKQPPALTLAGMLWLKRTFDPEYYDREFMQAKSVQRLPRAQRPKACEREYQSRAYAYPEVPYRDTAENRGG